MTIKWIRVWGVKISKKKKKYPRMTCWSLRRFKNEILSLISKSISSRIDHNWSRVLYWANDEQNLPGTTVRNPSPMIRLKMQQIDDFYLMSFSLHIFLCKVCPWSIACYDLYTNYPVRHNVEFLSKLLDLREMDLFSWWNYRSDRMQIFSEFSTVNDMQGVG